jgi:WD40-like Beta Propeller Repeat
MTRQRRVGLFVVISAAAIAVIVGSVLVAALGGEDDGTPTAAATPAVRIVSGDTLALDRDRAHPKAWGRVVIIDARGRRQLGKLTCERVAFAAGHGICLAQSRKIPTPGYEARFFDADQKVTGRASLSGTPSRARVSPDGRYASSTTFVAGDGYTTPGQFSTRTRIYDTATGDDFGDLEDFTVTKDDKKLDAQDLNFWGVTFTGQGARFYATLGTGGHHYLIAGDARTKAATVVRDGIECPSLSPDGTRIGYKARVGQPFQWRFHVLDLKTGKDVELTHEGSIDDQIAWLDDDTLAYGTGEQTMRVPADGSAPATLMLKSAVNPSRVA